LNFIGVIKKVTVCKISARYIYTDHQPRYENYKFSRRPVAKGVKRMRTLKKLKNFLTGGEAEKERRFLPSGRGTKRDPRSSEGLQDPGKGRKSWF